MYNLPTPKVRVGHVAAEGGVDAEGRGQGGVLRSEELLHQGALHTLPLHQDPSPAGNARWNTFRKLRGPSGLTYMTSTTFWNFGFLQVPVEIWGL